MRYLLFIMAISVIGIHCTAKTDQRSGDSVAKNLDLNTIGQKILDLAQVGEGERVLLVMAPGEFDDLIDILKKDLENRKANYLGCISVTENQPDSWKTNFTDKTRDKSAAELHKIFEEVDLGIMLPGAGVQHAPYKALQDILEDGIRRTIHFHWAGAYNLNGQLLETDLEKGLFYQDVILKTDYQAVAQSQQLFEEEMRGDVIHVSTPLGTNIQFEIGNRPVTKQDGDASAQRTDQALNLIDREIEIPCGAIRVAPIEQSVQGTIAFPNAEWNGKMVEDLVVTIKDGKITDLTASEGQDAVEAELDAAGAGSRSFREFALGFNPLMTIQGEEEKWIPYYGYGAGIVRLSLGNNQELGGAVGGNYVRWNFFTDATVTVGDTKWIDNGKMVR